jgi:hypothetical protein
MILHTPSASPLCSPSAARASPPRGFRARARAAPRLGFRLPTRFRPFATAAGCRPPPEDAQGHLCRHSKSLIHMLCYGERLPLSSSLVHCFQFKLGMFWQISRVICSDFLSNYTLEHLVHMLLNFCSLCSKIGCSFSTLSIFLSLFLRLLLLFFNQTVP